MKISTDIQLIGLSIYLSKSKTIIISDVHIGQEEALNKQGILIPRIYFQHLYKKTQNLIKKLDFNTLIINGDLKHEFGRISETEWRHTLRFLDLFKDKQVYLIKGNHDTILGPIAKRRNLELKDYIITDNTLIAHGDTELDIKELEKTNKTKIKTIIIGHEHPAITISSKNRAETFKCFLIGTHKRKKLIVTPSYNEMIEGTNILREQILSPYLKQNLNNFNVIVYGNQLYDFGKLKDIKKKFPIK